MPTVHLGNSAVITPLAGAQAVTHDGSDAPASPENSARPELGQQVTTISPPGDLPLGEQVQAVVAAYRSHSSEDPAWVEGDSDDDAALAQAVATFFDIPTESPDGHDDWKAR